MIIGIASPLGLMEFKSYIPSTPSEFKTEGGVAVHYIIRELFKKGFKIQIYTLSTEVNEVIEFGTKGISVLVGPYRNNSFHRCLNFFYNEIAVLLKMMKQRPATIINAHWGYEYAVAAIRIGKPHLISLRDNPWNVYLHSKDFYRLVRLLLNMWVMHNGKYFSANSPYLKEIFSLKKNIEVIPNSFDLDKFSAVANTSDVQTAKVRIISVINGWSKFKNPIPALRAFEIISNLYPNKYEYHLFGADFGQDSKAHEWAHANINIKDIYFHGKISHDDLLHLLPSFQIFLHPSLEESFGNAVLEAIYFGLNIIIGKQSGALPWLVCQGKYGHLVNVRSEIDIAKAIEKCQPVENKLKTEMREYVLNNYSSESITRLYLRKYEEIINAYN